MCLSTLSCRPPPGFGENRVSQLTDYDGTGIVYTYDYNGQVIKEKFSDGSTTEYDYNAAGLETQQKEVKPDNSTRRQILYKYDDQGNLTSEVRTGVDMDKIDQNVYYTYDAANRLTSAMTENVASGARTTANYTYDQAGNMLSDGTNTYTYDLQNEMTSKTGPGGTTNYTYDAAGNMISETGPDGTATYTYDGQNKLVKGEKSDGEWSSYTYNALGARTENVQYRVNVNASDENAPLNNGSANIQDYMPSLSDGRATWQRIWETEGAGTTVENNNETVTHDYVIDYTSANDNDIMCYEAGSFVQRYVYDPVNGNRLSVELTYADDTDRSVARNPGTNIASDFANNDIQKVWYRSSLTGSSFSNWIYGLMQ